MKSTNYVHVFSYLSGHLAIYQWFGRKSIFSSRELILSAMQSPEHQNSTTEKSNTVSVVEVATQRKSSTDTVSNLTEASSGGVVQFSSPIREADVGQPLTPEGRLILPIDEEAIDQGYDSDGCRAPWEGKDEEILNAVELEEDPLPTAPPPSLPLEVTPEIFAEKMCTPEEVKSMKVNEVKTELKKRGLSIKGKKNKIVKRLLESLERGDPIVQQLELEKARNLAGDHFSPGAFWELIECDGEYVNDVLPERFRSPTVPEGEVPLVKKRNYSLQFDRFPFTGTTELPKVYRNGSVAKTRDGKTVFEKKCCEETTVNMKFVRENKLDLDSHPVHWFEAFLPIRNGRKTNHFSMEKVLSWTNMRACVENASLGGKYNDFVNFTLDELLKHTAIYLFQGLSPSPQIEMKFHPQRDDPVNGNDFIFSSFGENLTKSKRRHRHFKSFFCSNNPNVPVPSRDTFPNWKVHPLLKHMRDVSQKAIFLGKNLSCDEQTIGFQGNHRDKQRITYKAEGDGFLADCICSDGYTYSFHFRHQPASQKIMEACGCSPLHTRVIGLISQLPDKGYTLGMDNLYMSTKLCRLAYSMEQKVMIHGVTRPSLRGIPPCIKQEEVKRKKELETVRHTVKVAVLRNDEVCKDLVSISLYDTKPVYFLTNVCTEITWTEKQKKVYDAIKKDTFHLPFHRLNVIDFYNNNMGNVDLADQLRNHYRIDTSWHRNRKWWWSIWWWGFQVLLTNSYVSYCKFHELSRKKPTYNHYEYIKAIALAWINREQYWPKTHNAETKKRKAMDEGVRRTRAMKKLDLKSDTSTQSTCIPINEKTLDAVNRKLKCRLNNSYQHLPERSSGNRSRCALHRWARNRVGEEVMSSVYTCSVCRVNLCIDCYSLFHRIPNIRSLKDEIAAS